MNARSEFPGTRPTGSSDDLLARYEAVSAAMAAADRAGLRDARARRLPGATKMYQHSVVRAYLLRRAHRRTA